MAVPGLSNLWAVLALLFFVRISIGFQFQSVPPLAPQLIAEWGIGYTEIGWLIGVFQFAGIALALPSGLVGQRFGDRPVIVAGLVLMTAGTALFAIAPAYPVALAGRVLSSFGVVLLNVQLTKVTTDWFAGHRLATAMAILMSSWPAGLAIGLSSLGFLADLAGWRTAVAVTVAYSGAMLALFLLLYRDPPQGAPASPAGQRLWVIQRHELSRIVAAGLVWMLLNAAFIVFLSFTPALLTGRGAPAALAGFVAGLASWVSIASVPLGGLLTDRTGRVNAFIAGGAVACSLVALLHAYVDAPWLWVLLFGIVLGGPPGAIMTLPGQVLSPESRNTGFGVFYTVFYLGMVLLVPVAGWLQDVTGTARAPILFSAALMLAALPALGALRLLQRRLPAPAAAMPRAPTVHS